MSEGSRSKARGRFKGKKITFASTARVEEFAVVAMIDAGSERLVDIFAEIVRRRSVH